MAADTFALVTGASGGIGRELSLQLARRGWNLIITGRREEPLQEIRAAIPNRSVHIVVADLSRPQGAEDLLRYIATHSLTVEILANNAGFGRIGHFTELSIDDQLDMVEVNVSSTLRITHTIVRQMVERGHGYVLNVASTAAFAPGPLMAAYYATKAFEYAFSMALGEELHKRGIVVTTLCPGATETGFDRAAGLEGVGRRHGRMMSAKRVAQEGLDGLFRRRRLVVPGTLNKLAVFAARIGPQRLLLTALFRFNAAK